MSASARLSEELVALRQEVTVWLKHWVPRHQELLLLDRLQPMRQHGPVGIVQDVITNFEHEIGRDPQNLPVVRGVVEWAHGDTIGDNRLTPRVAIWQDV